MMQPVNLHRRELILSAGLSVAAGSAPQAGSPQPGARPRPFRYCCNTGTLRGFKLPLDQELTLIAKAGYQAVEPWVSEIIEHQKSGGSLRDLRKRLADLGLNYSIVATGNRTFTRC